METMWGLLPAADAAAAVADACIRASTRAASISIVLGWGSGKATPMQLYGGGSTQGCGGVWVRQSARGES
jgi:hypothetical protein